MKVIECNARASRSFPFVSKTTGIDLSALATHVMIDKVSPNYTARKISGNFVGVKAPVFSFNRLSGADPVLGVEMVSTGEIGCVSHSFEESTLLAFQSSNIRLPKKGVLISAGSEHEKARFLLSVKMLESLNVPIFATLGTAAYLAAHGTSTRVLAWPGSGGDTVIKAIQEGWVDFVINIPKSLAKEELQHSAEIRKMATRYNCSLLTDIEKVNALFFALAKMRDMKRDHKLVPLSPFLLN